MAISRRECMISELSVTEKRRVELLCWESGKKVNMDRERCQNGDFAKGVYDQ